MKKEQTGRINIDRKVANRNRKIKRLEGALEETTQSNRSLYTINQRLNTEVAQWEGRFSEIQKSLETAIKRANDANERASRMRDQLDLSEVAVRGLAGAIEYITN